MTEAQPGGLHPVIRYLTERHLGDEGGYPWPGTWIGDTFVWCDWGRQGDYGKHAFIGTITQPGLDAWLERAREYAREGGEELALPSDDEPGAWLDFDWEAFDETAPEQ
jgi:hypothetical protein